MRKEDDEKYRISSYVLTFFNTNQNLKNIF